MTNNQTTRTEISPKKSLGQNFLVNQGVIKKIIEVAQIKKTDNILEVGPGRGAITFKLAERAKRVLAVEKDKDLFNELTNFQFSPRQCSSVNSELGTGQAIPNSRFRLICADVLDLDVEQIRRFFSGEPYRIIANLPYNITSHFLRRFLEMEYHPRDMLLMVQREVGQRIVAKPGQMSLLAVSAQFFASPKIEFVVKAGSFYPAPKVDSVIISLKNIAHDKFDVDQKKFFEIVKLGFSQKRKQLKSLLLQAKFLAIKPNLAQLERIFVNLGFSPTVRAQELSVQDWVNLVNKLGR